MALKMAKFLALVWMFWNLKVPHLKKQRQKIQFFKN
jgi:hypothetical protein